MWSSRWRSFSKPQQTYRKFQFSWGSGISRTDLIWSTKRAFHRFWSILWETRSNFPSQVTAYKSILNRQSFPSTVRTSLFWPLPTRDSVWMMRTAASCSSRTFEAAAPKTVLLIPSQTGLAFTYASGLQTASAVNFTCVLITEKDAGLCSGWHFSRTWTRRLISCSGDKILGRRNKKLQ